MHEAQLRLQPARSRSLLGTARLGHTVAARMLQHESHALLRRSRHLWCRALAALASALVPAPTQAWLLARMTVQHASMWL